MAGRASRTGAAVTAERNGGARILVSLVEQGERIGVVAMTVLADCVRLAGLLMGSIARTIDLVHVRRRRHAADALLAMAPTLTAGTARRWAVGGA